MMKTFDIASSESMQALAANVAKQLAAPNVIVLNGTLGAGKTTFCQGFLRGVGVESLIKSPTYSLIETYVIGETHYYHLDLYRLRSPQEIYDLGIEDCFSSDSIVLIEWPEKAANLLPKATLTIDIEPGDDDFQRKVKCLAHTSNTVKIVESLKGNWGS